jgi:hypothetical protein
MVDNIPPQIGWPLGIILILILIVLWLRDRKLRMDAEKDTQHIYVRHDGVWVQAEPYIKRDGEWRKMTQEEIDKYIDDDRKKDSEWLF